MDKLIGGLGESGNIIKFIRFVGSMVPHLIL